MITDHSPEPVKEFYLNTNKYQHRSSQAPDTTLRGGRSLLVMIWTFCTAGGRVCGTVEHTLTQNTQTISQQREVVER